MLHVLFFLSFICLGIVLHVLIVFLCITSLCLSVCLLFMFLWASLPDLNTHISLHLTFFLPCLALVYLHVDEAQRISGKVSGVVNGFRLDDVDLHAYVVTNDGRTYTAISRIPDTVGYSLQSLYAVGSILGFLFALPQQPMLHNGFVLTGRLRLPWFRA